MRNPLYGLVALALAGNVGAQAPWYQGRGEVDGSEYGVPLPEIVDLNEDGYLDLVVIEGSAVSKVVFLENVGGPIGQRPAFEKHILASQNSSLRRPKVVDLFDESELGILVGSGPQLKYYTYDPNAVDPGWYPRTLATTPNSSMESVSDISFGDFNGDGRIDMAIASLETSIAGIPSTPKSFYTVWIQNEGETFQKILVFDHLYQDARTAVADFDGDGTDELIISTNQLETAQLLRIHPEADPKFSLVPIPSIPAFSAVKIGDVDDDGHLDIVATQRATGHALFAYISNGDYLSDMPDFNPVNTGIAQSNRNPRFDLYDVNGDGAQDIIVPTVDRLRLLTYNTEGGFDLDFISDPTPDVSSIEGLKVADLDNDGVPEILVQGQSDPLVYYYQVPGASITSFTDISDPQAWDLGSEGVVKVVVKNTQTFTTEEALLTLSADSDTIAFEPTTHIVPEMDPDEELIFQSTFRYLSTAPCGEEGLALAALSGPATNDHRQLYLPRIGEYVLGDSEAGQTEITPIPDNDTTGTSLTMHLDSEGGIVTSFMLHVEINHPNPTQLTYSLTDPDGRVATLRPYVFNAKDLHPYDNYLVLRFADNFIGRIYDGEFTLTVKDKAAPTSGHILGWRMRTTYYRYDCEDLPESRVADSLDYFLNAKSSLIQATHADTNQDGTVDSADVTWTIIGE